MRLLLVGSTAPWAIEQFYTRYLTEMGVTLEIFDPSNYISFSILNRMLLRSGSLQPYNAANEALLKAAVRFQPHIIWIFKGVEIHPQTLLNLKGKGIKLANYNPDHPFIRTFFSNGGKNVEDCVPLYDLHFCYSRDLMARIASEFNIRTAWLPFGYELSDSAYERISKAEEIHRIGFIGNPDKTRARIVRLLTDAGLPVDVYGHNWKRFVTGNRNLQIYDAVFGDALWKKLRQYRVQLNIFRPHNINSHNMRTFEVPAVGGIMLAPESEEHRGFFSHGEEAFFYKSYDEIEHYCAEIMALANVEHIRKSARERSVTDDYSYSNRVNHVFTNLEYLNLP